MLFSVIYSADVPESNNILDYAPPQCENLWDETEDDGQYDYEYLEGEWEHALGATQFSELRELLTRLNSAVTPRRADRVGD